MPAKASRAAFGEALIELGAKDSRIVTVDADLSKSTMTAGFAKKYPDRAFNLGIAESKTKQVIAYAVEHQGPLYLRLTRQNLEAVSPSGYQFRLGTWMRLREGTHVTIIGSGGTVFNALEAAKQLAADGIQAEVINAS